MSVTISAPARARMTAVKTAGGVIKWIPEGQAPRKEACPTPAGPRPAPVLRVEVGETLRRIRQAGGWTLRSISADAMVSLGYISEVERGKKEVSSEMLSAICGALGVTLAAVLREVADRIELAEGITVPDSVPESMAQEVLLAA